MRWGGPLALALLISCSRDPAPDLREQIRAACEDRHGEGDAEGP